MGITISKAKNNGQSVWRVNVSVSVAGKRMRKFFASQVQAVHWVDDFEAKIKTHGLASLQSEGKTVSEVLERFWALKQLDGLHRQTAKTVLTQFARKFGAVPIGLVSPLQLHAFWTREDWSLTQRSKVFRYLRLFFNWAERYDFIDRNPARRVEAPKVREQPKRILTPDRMAELLANPDEILRAFLCLGGFVGLRSSEILALKPESIRKTEIYVKSGKTSERFVSLLPAFKRHWISLPKFPATADFYAHIRRVSGGEWPTNCLRHSFGSYHLSAFEDAGKTAFQMGNSAAVVRQSYARAVPKSEAKKWWKL